MKCQGCGLGAGGLRAAPAASQADALTRQGHWMSESKPTRTVVVVGAGIVGVSTALWLLRDGHRVIIVDPNGPAGGTSYGNAGILANSSIVPVTTPGLVKKVPGMLFNPMGALFLKWGYLPRLLPWLWRYLSHCRVDEVERIAAALMPIIGDSVDQHFALARGTPAERFIEPMDYLYAYEDRAAYLKDALAWRIRREHGFEVHEVEEETLRREEPSLGPGLRFGVRLPGHAWVRDPGAYVQALCAHAQEQGAILKLATVVGFERNDERVLAVQTDQGALACDDVVLAAGVWSKALAQMLGVDVPMESERGYHLELFGVTNGPAVPVALAAHKFIATPMDGRLRLAGLVEFGGLTAPPSEGPYRLLTAQVKVAFPNIDWQSEKRWQGHRPATTDSIPVVGPLRDIAGVHMAFGHQHVGLTGGPKTGRIVADVIAGRRPNIDLSPYRAERFSSL
ncbi:MAG: D-amino-acid dehydrogenase [Gammaproteobacteria bacterium]|jgi:D-amino-acid dehydrogenase